MSYFPDANPQGIYTFGNYALFVSAPVTPATGLVLLGTTAADVGSFIMTEALAYCSTGPTATPGSPVQLTFNMGWTAATYNDWVSAQLFGSDGSAPNVANNLLQYKFKKINIIVPTVTLYAVGTPRNTATALYANVTAVTGAVTTEKVQFVISGFYTGLR